MNIKTPDIESDAAPHTPDFNDLVALIEKLFKDSLEATKAFTPEEIEQGWQRYKALNHLYQDEVAPAGAVWVKADQKPEYNVGVLVFIPGEDNHITSGMWDISKEWVLLDEYRTPDEEVTHWMPLPAIPEGYEDETPAEIVSILKEIAKESLPKFKKFAPSKEHDSVDLIQRIRDFNLSDIDAPVFTHTKEFEAHFSYIKGKLMDIISKQPNK